MKIHPTAIISPGANLANDVEVGPFTVIGKDVSVEEGTVIGASCYLEGPAKIGKRCRIFTAAVIGSPPQDLKYKGERTELLIGDDNTIREYATINRATGEGKATVIGNGNLLMAYSHIAHNCRIGCGVIIANAGTLAGHVEIEDKAIVGGLVAIHQFVRVGMLSIIGGCSKVVQDIPPYALVDGHPARVYGLNNVGLKRAGISAEARASLKHAFKIFFFSGLSFTSAQEKIKTELPATPEIAHLIDFIKKTSRGISH